MSTNDQQSTKSESADQELSKSLSGHADLPDENDGSEQGGDVSTPAADGKPSEPLAEVEDSPVRTKNS
ncbi:hypothetical protein GM708_04325 [Vibrio cholerae]|nr:hypothetical protein [Vibrio cholerae]